MNLRQRLMFPEEFLKVEKRRKDKLGKTVNNLDEKLEQTKQTFTDKCTALKMRLHIHVYFGRIIFLSDDSVTV